jgi:hypothetical protein
MSEMQHMTRTKISDTGRALAVPGLTSYVRL